jgi:hypothetical protein
MAFMHPCRCLVSFTDTNGILHEVEVYADSVYEAVGAAMQEFRSGGIPTELPTPMTEFTVAVHRRPVTHKLQLKKVTSWAEGGGKSPMDVLARQRIRHLLLTEG